MSDTRFRICPVYSRYGVGIPTFCTPTCTRYAGQTTFCSRRDVEDTYGAWLEGETQLSNDRMLQSDKRFLEMETTRRPPSEYAHLYAEPVMLRTDLSFDRQFSLEELDPKCLG